MIANSMIAPVLCARIEYCLVSSTTVITEQTEVSLNSAMKSLVTGGMTIRTACGRMMRRMRLTPTHSQSTARLPSVPRGMACKPAR